MDCLKCISRCLFHICSRRMILQTFLLAVPCYLWHRFNCPVCSCRKIICCCSSVWAEKYIVHHVFTFRSSIIERWVILIIVVLKTKYSQIRCVFKQQQKTDLWVKLLKKKKINKTFLEDYQWWTLFIRLLAFIFKSKCHVIQGYVSVWAPTAARLWPTVLWNTWENDWHTLVHPY